jgi:uncharacterized membrane protein
LGSVIGALKEVGIEEDFMKDLAVGLTPGSPELFVVVRRASPDTIAEVPKDSGDQLLSYKTN